MPGDVRARGPTLWHSVSSLEPVPAPFLVHGGRRLSAARPQKHIGPPALQANHVNLAPTSPGRPFFIWPLSSAPPDGRSCPARWRPRQGAHLARYLVPQEAPKKPRGATAGKCQTENSWATPTGRPPSWRACLCWLAVCVAGRDSARSLVPVTHTHTHTDTAARARVCVRLGGRVWLEENGGDLELGWRLGGADWEGRRSDGGRGEALLLRAEIRENSIQFGQRRQSNWPSRRQKGAQKEPKKRAQKIFGHCLGQLARRRAMASGRLARSPPSWPSLAQSGKPPTLSSGRNDVSSNGPPKGLHWNPNWSSNECALGGPRVSADRPQIGHKSGQDDQLADRFRSAGLRLSSAQLWAELLRPSGPRRPERRASKAAGKGANLRANQCE